MTEGRQAHSTLRLALRLLAQGGSDTGCSHDLFYSVCCNICQLKYLEPTEAESLDDPDYHGNMDAARPRSLRRCYNDVQDTLSKIFETKLKDDDSLEAPFETPHRDRADEKQYSPKDRDGTESPAYHSVFVI